jgi:hypothetical protein
MAFAASLSHLGQQIYVYLKTCECTGKKEEHDYISEGHIGFSMPPVFVGRRFYRCKRCGKETPYKDPPPPAPRVIDLDLCEN